MRRHAPQIRVFLHLRPTQRHSHALWRRYACYGTADRSIVLRRRVESYVNSLAARRRRQAVGTRDLQGLVLQVDAARSRAAVGNIQRRYTRRSVVNHVRYVLCRRYTVIARYAYRSARVGKSALLHVVRNRSVRTGRSRRQRTVFKRQPLAQ